MPPKRVGRSGGGSGNRKRLRSGSQQLQNLLHTLGGYAQMAVALGLLILSAYILGAGRINVGRVIRRCNGTSCTVNRVGLYDSWLRALAALTGSLLK